MKELTDFELNKAIAEELGIYCRNSSSTNMCFVLHEDEAMPRDFDPAFEWSDLMPLVEQHRLIIVPYKDDLWEAYSEIGGFVIYNKKYLRAGAECLLKLLQTEKG